MRVCVYSVHSDKKANVLTIRRTDDNKNEDLINSVSKYFYNMVKFRSNWISTITLFWAGMLNRTTPSPWKGDVQPLHQIRIMHCYPGRIRTYEITEPNSVALDRWATGQLFVEQAGFEPTTIRSSIWHSTNWVTVPNRQRKLTRCYNCFWQFPKLLC